MKDDRTGETSHHFHIKDEDVKRNDGNIEEKVRGPADDQSREEIIKKLNRMFADLEEEYDSREQFIQTTADQEDTKPKLQTAIPSVNKTVSVEDLTVKQSTDLHKKIQDSNTESIDNDKIKVNENISQNMVTEMMRYSPQGGLSKLNVGVIKYS